MIWLLKPINPKATGVRARHGRRYGDSARFAIGEGQAHGVLRTFDGKLLHVAAVHGEPDVVERVKKLGPVEVGLARAGDLLGRIVGGDRVVHIADVRETDAYRDIPVARQRLEIDGIRTWLAVALHREGALLGVIIAYRKEVRPFSDKEIALLENFAAQAVIAMENARLLTETREALDQQTATAEVLQVINSSPGDLAPVFEAMLDKAMHLCEAAFGVLQTYDGRQVRVAATRGVPAAFVEFRKNNPPAYGPGTGPAGILAGERVVHIVDLKDEDGYRSDPSNPPTRFAKRGPADRLIGSRSTIQLADDAATHFRTASARRQLKRSGFSIIRKCPTPDIGIKSIPKSRAAASLSHGLALIAILGTVSSRSPCCSSRACPRTSVIEAIAISGGAADIPTTTRSTRAGSAPVGKKRRTKLSIAVPKSA